MGSSNQMVRRMKVLQTINVTNLELAWKSAIPKIQYLLEAFRDPVLTCFEFVSRRFLAFWVALWDWFQIIKILYSASDFLKKCFKNKTERWPFFMYFLGSFFYLWGNFEAIFSPCGYFWGTTGSFLRSKNGLGHQTYPKMAPRGATLVSSSPFVWLFGSIFWYFFDFLSQPASQPAGRASSGDGDVWELVAGVQPCPACKGSWALSSNLNGCASTEFPWVRLPLEVFFNCTGEPVCVLCWWSPWQHIT